MLFISGHFNPPKRQKRRRVGIHAHRNGQKHCRVGFQPTAKLQGFDCKYFRQPENVIKPRGQQVAHPTLAEKIKLKDFI